MSEIIEIKGQCYIRANASIADAGARVLKNAETFAVFDRHGDIRPLGFENHGLFHEGVRFLSRWKLLLNGTSPLLLSSNVKEDNDFLVVDMTNPPLSLDNGGCVPQGTIHIVRTIFLGDGSFFERLAISNFGLEPVSLPVEFVFQADFADLFEIRGSKRHHRGQSADPEMTQDQITLHYRGLDSVERRTQIHFTSAPQSAFPDRAVFQLELTPQSTKEIDTEILLLVGPEDRARKGYKRAFHETHLAFENYRRQTTQLKTSNPQFNDWLNQSRADLHMLLTQTPSGPYPYAGIPWFSCIFGRDGIITAMETLWLYPEIARGVLGYLASRQADETDPAKDAQPGKILHEERKGEMPALGEVPFGSYYGSIDSTPLWVTLAGHYLQRTGDSDYISSLWPHIRRALSWIDTDGDSDGDGFVEYSQRASGGLSNQGWKDADDSVFHADGRLPRPPIALCEVQGYVYEAKLRAAEMADALGFYAEAAQWRKEAEELKSKFHATFWRDEIQSYAIALDGDKQPCSILSSNAGQCLFSGIAKPEAARQIKNHLLRENFFSGWGIRTIPTDQPRYNPMSYHNGSVWPHDNALIAFGLARYGFKDAALKILNALFDSSRFMDLNRLPELFCGFQRRRGEGPTLYPVACNPQAWSSAAVFFLLQACLGLRVEANRGRLCFDKPCLPEAIAHLSIDNLKIGDASVDVSLARQEHNVAVNVRHRVGDPQVVVVH